MVANVNDQPDDCLFRAVLSCVAELERSVERDERQKPSNSVVVSTRALIALLESWSVDHATRTRCEAIRHLSIEEKNDATILAALRSTYTTPA